MANKRRPKQLTFRVSEEEETRLRKKIEESGKNQQEYIIAAVLNREIINRTTNTDGLKEFIPELKRIGNNLNQTTRALNDIDGALKDSSFYSYKKITEVLDEAKKNQEELASIWQLLKEYLHTQGSDEPSTT
ncbi:MAG: plasmid mobilization relaxosome protein MobC [Lachnospiraceae bacterium]|nr:plasmid mobilization relaxosome protein MobC [Lachnospiraceae bacterium]